MTRIVDKRKNGKNRSAVNRRRFLQRYKQQIKRAVADAVSQRSITDIEQGERINIPTRDISEPTFRHGRGGRREIVHPGNEEFLPGDKIPRPKGGGAGGSGSGKASKDGEGVDEFAFELSKEEFMEFFFEDLELPNLVKRKLTAIKSPKSVRAGFTTDGSPNNINVIRSLRSALGRRIALGAPYRKRLREAQERLEALKRHPDPAPESIRELEDEIRRLRIKINAIPFLDPVDLRYNHRITVPQPSTQAVMFCLMDVSGSMDQLKKEIAKRFFILLYLFLTRNYERIDIVFLRHHTIAKEVDEHDFFYSRETGGTVVSSVLELMRDIVAERYDPEEWNIYAAQASDGDNWHDDSPRCRELLLQDILPKVQYFAYVEITPEHHQSLWYEYQEVAAACAHFAMQRIDGPGDIYPVFRELFKKQEQT